MQSFTPCFWGYCTKSLINYFYSIVLDQLASPTVFLLNVLPVFHQSTEMTRWQVDSVTDAISQFYYFQFSFDRSSFLDLH